MDRFWIGTDRNVLFHVAEVRARRSSTCRQVQFSVVAVRDRTFDRHAQAMLQGSVRQSRIPRQAPHARTGTRCVRQRKKLCGFHRRRFRTLSPRRQSFRLLRDRMDAYRQIANEQQAAGNRATLNSIYMHPFSDAFHAHRSFSARRIQPESAHSRNQYSSTATRYAVNSPSIPCAGQLPTAAR